MSSDVANARGRPGGLAGAYTPAARGGGAEAPGNFSRGHVSPPLRTCWNLQIHFTKYNDIAIRLGVHVRHVCEGVD